jgi:hypothetical protein
MAARLRHPSAPLVLLAVISLLSLGARFAWLDQPCHSPCTTAADHTLVFDESYYVNAARVIAGLKPPAGAPYARAPGGTDPNSEHPQLAKLVIAAAIELFGDGPFAWRIGSILLGSIAILGMFALVRAGGGGRWPALGASALMAADNLLLVHSRIGTLDIYALAAMLCAVTLYLRGRPLWAGVVLGIGSCAKLVAPYAWLVLALIELLRFWVGRRAAAGTPPRFDPRAAGRHLASCGVAMVGTFLALLDLMDRIAPPYNPATHELVDGGPFGHLAHMLSYQTQLTSPHGPTGIASYPWEWLVDYKPIVYLNINPARPAPGLYDIHPAAHFLGMISPPIMLLALPALFVAAWRIVRGGTQSEIAIVAVAWFVGTFLPFELLSVLDSRTSYLYYMVAVMPGIYVAIVYLFARLKPPRWLLVSWAALVLIAAIVMFPFTPLPFT